MLKRKGYAFNIIRVQGFCPLKLKLLNFLVDSVLILWGLSHIPTPQS